MDSIRRVDFAMCRRVLLAWNALAVEELTRKQIAADNLHHYLLIKKCFADWKKVSFLANYFLAELPCSFFIR